MARKGVFPIVATLAVVGVALAVFSQTVMRDSNISTNTMTRFEREDETHRGTGSICKPAAA